MFSTVIQFIPSKVNSYIDHAPIIHISGAFYLFGGHSEALRETTIGRFDLAFKRWSKSGNLETARSGHNVIYDNQYVIVVGGNPGLDAPVHSEKCAISIGRVACNSQAPELANYSYYPELFLVPADFCKNLL